jgi:hypothetical protein
VDFEAYELPQQLQISVPVFCLASFSIGWIVTVLRLQSRARTFRLTRRPPVQKSWVQRASHPAQVV